MKGEHQKLARTFEEQKALLEKLLFLFFLILYLNNFFRDVDKLNAKFRSTEELAKLDSSKFDLECHCKRLTCT